MNERIVEVRVDPPYQVRVGAGIVGPAFTGEIARRAESWKRTFVLTDANVERLHGDTARVASSARENAAQGLPRSVVHSVPAGEGSKSFATLERVLDALIAAGCDKKSGLVAFGGGVVGDLGGLAAALFHRGIPFVQVPTTLLAMVDSSVGGKTAVNLAGGKNLAGVFHQPVLVAADVRFLATLSDDEYRSGLGEVVKTAVLDATLFERIGRAKKKILKRDPSTLVAIVEACVDIKARIVARDPYEESKRKVLNLGHTFAHAIEHTAGFGTIPHGVAVAVGLVLVTDAAVHAGTGLLEGFPESLRALLSDLDLPADLDALRKRYSTELAPDALVEAMSRDKKARGGKPLYVVPLAPGMVLHDTELPASAVRAALES